MSTITTLKNPEEGPSSNPKKEIPSYLIMSNKPHKNYIQAFKKLNQFLKKILF